MIIRIPNTKLDTILREIAKNIDFLDYRVIKAEDVSLEILSNNLTQKRAGRNEKRLTSAIDSKGKKLGETTDAEEAVLSKQEQADQANIANMAIVDKTKLSRIDLTIYQRPSVRRELIHNPTNIEEYEPAFGLKLVTAFKSGWDTFESLLVFLVNLWAVLLFGLVAYLIYQRYGYGLRKGK
jgi:hypothetical protein